MPRAKAVEPAAAPAPMPAQPTQAATSPTTVPGATAAPGALTHAAAGGPTGVKRASFDPDKAVQTGLPSKFNGTLIYASYLPRKYGEKAGDKAGKWICACELNIIPDDQSLANHQLLMPDGTRVGVVREVLTADDLNQWVPSADGINPAGTNLEGFLNLHNGASLPDEQVDLLRGYSLIAGAQNNRDSVKKGTKFIQFTAALKKAKVPMQIFLKGAEDLRDLFGIYGHWAREEFVPPQGVNRMPKAGEKERTDDTLVLVEFMQMRGAGAGAVAGAAVVGQQAPGVPPVAASAPLAQAPAPVAAGQGAPSNPAVAALAPAIEQHILALLHAQKQANPTPPGYSSGELMNDVFTHFQANGGQGALAITILNDAAWFFSEDRLYWTIPHKGRIALTEEDAGRLSA